MFIQAVNEMFVQYKDGTIYIGASLPPQINDFSCRLAVAGGIVAEVSVENGCLKKLRLTGNVGEKAVEVAVFYRLLPEKLCGDGIKSVGDFRNYLYFPS